MCMCLCTYVYIRTIYSIDVPKLLCCVATVSHQKVFANPHVFETFTKNIPKKTFKPGHLSGHLWLQYVLFLVASFSQSHIILLFLKECLIALALQSAEIELCLASGLARQNASHSTMIMETSYKRTWRYCKGCCW